FAIARIGAGATSQTAMIGPVSLVFFGWWLLDEPVTVLQLAGTAVVLVGIALLARAPAPAKVPVAE
ncbi:MAG: EamA family transporter, partial [Pseudomonadota bacterium]